MTIIRSFPRKRESSGHPSALWRKTGSPLSRGRAVCARLSLIARSGYSLGPIEQRLDVLRHPGRVARRRRLLSADPLLLHHLLAGVAQEERNELVGAVGIRRIMQDGDGIDRLRRDFRRQCQRRYLGVRGFGRIEEAD